MSKASKHIILFFLITFAWTWVCYFAIILSGFSPYEGIGIILLICGGCAPTFTGLLMALITYNKVDKLDFLKSCYQVKRIGVQWWLLILLLFPAIYTVSILFNMLMGGVLPGMDGIHQVLLNPISFMPMLLFAFISGPFAEELGWRGFALKPLLDKFGFTKASILLGILWSVWHLPLFFMPDTWQGQMEFYGVFAYLAQSIGLSMIMSFVFIKTKHSILSALMMHLTSNFTASLLMPFSETVMITSFLLILTVGIALCVNMSMNKEDIPAQS